MHRQAGNWSARSASPQDPLLAVARAERVDAEDLLTVPDDQQVAVGADVVEHGVVETGAVPTVAHFLAGFDMGLEPFGPQSVEADDGALLRIERDRDVGEEGPPGRRYSNRTSVDGAGATERSATPFFRRDDAPPARRSIWRATCAPGASPGSAAISSSPVLPSRQGTLAH